MSNPEKLALFTDAEPKEQANMHHIVSSKSAEWYTPAPYIEAARLVMGAIDLDPASSELANRTVKAAKFFTEQDKGLHRDWPGRVFMNPPYRRDGIQGLFVNKLVMQYRIGVTTEAILLIGNRTETEWFQPLWDFPICFTNHRISFISPDGKADSPVNANVFVYFGPHSDKFKEVYSRFGTVVIRL
jgi:phage N-6-adenine-methyltransferase